MHFHPLLILLRLCTIALMSSSSVLDQLALQPPFTSPTRELMYCWSIVLPFPAINAVATGLSQPR